MAKNYLSFRDLFNEGMRKQGFRVTYVNRAPIDSRQKDKGKTFRDLFDEGMRKQGFRRIPVNSRQLEEI